MYTHDDNEFPYLVYCDRICRPELNQLDVAKGNAVAAFTDKQDAVSFCHKKNRQLARMGFIPGSMKPLEPSNRIFITAEQAITIGEALIVGHCTPLEFFKQFRIHTTSELPASRFTEALEWIKRQ